MQINLHGRRVNKRLIGKAPLVAGSASGTLQTKSVEPTMAEQVLVPDSGYEGLSRVNVGRVSRQVKGTTAGAAAQVVTPDEGIMCLAAVGVSGAKLQRKTVKPTTGTQTVTADSGYYGLGALELQEAKLQGKVVTPSREQQFITPDEGYAGLSGVAVLPEADLIPENIRAGVTIFGVKGTYGTAADGGGDSGGSTGGGDNPGDGSGGNSPDTEQTATMYSYNGTVLPKLPEWDKGKYPYALILGRASLAYCIVSTVPMYRSKRMEGTVMETTDVKAKQGGSSIISTYDITNADYPDAWQPWGAETAFQADKTVRSSTTDDVRWANYDVYNKDNTIYLSASEPIPVLE